MADERLALQNVGINVRAFILSLLCAKLLTGCAASVTRVPVPAHLVDEAQVASLPNVRYWGDTIPEDIKQAVAEGDRQTRAMRPHLFDKRGERTQFEFLAISGGGSDGAFGAGLLVGWTKSGKRPEFDLVTGISTGALAAPFVFLGPAYDRQLQEVYTQYGTENLLEPQIITGLLGGSAVTDNRKLAGVIANYVDARMLRVIAREHLRGRRLLIGTTNIDAERPVVWNMGRIALGGNEEALNLFRKVLLASASIPAFLPPVKIDVTAGGKALHELHVDGGTTGQVFFLPPQLLIESIAPPKGLPRSQGTGPTKLRLYIVMNQSLQPKFTTTKATTASIAGRSLSTLIKQQATGDLYKLYVATRSNRIDYNLASVPDTFVMEAKEPFDRVYMGELFKTGVELGSSDYQWTKAPPGITTSGER